MQIKGVDETTAEIVRQYFSKYMMAEICITRYGMLSPAALKSMGVYIKDKFNDVNQEAKDAIWSITKANVSGVAAQLSPYACSGMIQSLLQIFPRNILMPQGESKSPF
ncbi:MAG: hypothetical protein B7Y61_03045 [Rhizobiales bacterium 35-66-30]|nr:MAG: hypothetical protein B7Y61_03045 [Rhizobiales bacterium 35-66-30]